MMRILLFIAAAPLWAQIGAPSLGYLVDGARLRPVAGIPASASIGAALGGIDFSLASAAPGRDLALGALRGSGRVVVYRGGEIVAVAGAGDGPDGIAMSPGGTAAVLWFGESRRLQVIRDLPGNPQARHMAFTDGAPSELAVSDDGQVVAGVWGAELRTFGPESKLAVRTLESPHALAFLHGSHELAFAAGNWLFIGEGTQISHEGAEVVALGFTARNRRIVWVSASGHLVARSLSDGSTVVADCACTPQGLFRASASAFRFTGFEPSGFRLFDSDAGQILQVPLSAGLAAGEVGQ